MNKIVEVIRKQFGDGDKKRDAGLVSPSDIVRYDDIAYAGTSEKLQTLDVYRPLGAQGALPVIVSVHGGAWVYGDKDVYQYYCMSLAQRGFAVVNFSYRLAPEWKYPSSFEDVTSVLSWMQSNSKEYGFDLDNVFAVGDSAGAHMLGLYCAAIANKEFAKTCGFETAKDFSFKAIALNCGAYLIEDKGDADMTSGLMGQYLPNGGTSDELAMVSLVNHLNSAFPPVFMMTCPGDFLCEQPSHIIPLLEENGVEFIYRHYGNKAKPLGHVFHCNIKLPEATLCNDEECAFFKSFLSQ